MFRLLGIPAGEKAMSKDLTIEEFVLQSGFTPPTDTTVPDPHIVELLQVWDSMRMQREAKLREALRIAKALTKKYLSRISFGGLDDREITELREVHYQAEEALRSEYPKAMPPKTSDPTAQEN